MGLPDNAGCQLVSAELDVVHAGCGAVRTRPGGTAFDECAAACRQWHPALSALETADRIALAQCVCRRLVRAASAPRGTGGMGVGTKGCAKHVLRASGAARLCPLC